MICGGGAKLPGLAEYLSHRLGLPVTARGVFDNPQMLAYESEETDSGLDFAIACGLALCNQIKGAHPKAAPQDAAPKKAKKEKPEKAPKKAKSWRKAPKKGKNETTDEPAALAIEAESTAVELELVSSETEPIVEIAAEAPPMIEEAPESTEELEIAPPPALTSEVEDLVAQVSAETEIEEAPEPVAEVEPPITLEAEIVAQPVVEKKLDTGPPPNVLGVDDLLSLMAAPPIYEDDPVAEAEPAPKPPAAIVPPPVMAAAPEPIEEFPAAPQPALTSEAEDLIAMISASPVVPEYELPPVALEPEPTPVSETEEPVVLEEPEPIQAPESHVPPAPVMNEIEALLAEIAEPVHKKAKASEPLPTEPEIVAEAPTPPVEPEAEAVVEPEAEAATDEPTTTKKRGRSRKAA